MLDLLDDEPIVYRTMITLLLHTGLRRGELCGLEWDDINFDPVSYTHLDVYKRQARAVYLLRG